MVRHSDPVSVWDLGALLGEGPVWVQRDPALWFVDIKSRKIHRFDPASDDKKSWDAPGQCGFVLPMANGGFVAGLQQGLHRFDERDGSFTLLTQVEPERPGNRLNDGVVDPAGRLWFGSMDDGEAEETGAIYRLGVDGRPVVESPLYAITNGPALSPDGRTLYHVDTLKGVIYACAVGEEGAPSDRRIFATIPNAEGHPDGPAVDAEGCIWVSLYNGWGVRRYAPTGELLQTIDFPVSAITKVTFGGPDLKTVYATTACKHLSEEERAKEPLAGDLFSFDIDVPGLPGHLISVGV